MVCYEPVLFKRCLEQVLWVTGMTVFVTAVCEVCDCSILYESALGMKLLVTALGICTWKLLVTASVESAVVLVFRAGFDYFRSSLKIFLWLSCPLFM